MGSQSLQDRRGLKNIQPVLPPWHEDKLDSPSVRDENFLDYPINSSGG